jgi:hypothetical protein
LPDSVAVIAIAVAAAAASCYCCGYHAVLWTLWLPPPICTNYVERSPPQPIGLVTFACATMISHFIFSFASALLISSSLPSAATYQCHIDDNAKCPGICCNYQDPYRLLVGPTCSIQAFLFSS